MKHLTLDDIKIPAPDYSAQKLSKTQIVSNWLVDWIKHCLDHGIADFGDFIPKKEVLANFLNVSSATMQNSIRIVKNMGYFSSKQSLGTYIADFTYKDIKPKDDLCRGTIAECKIKKIILDHKIKINSPIFSINELSSMTDISKNTIRAALSTLESCGYLEKKQLKGNKFSWIYKKEFELTKQELQNGIYDENLTLTHQLVEKIKNYIEKTYKQGDKILPNTAFCAMFDVSIKTINDAMKILNAQKIILSRRGRYGTIYLGNPKNSKTEFVTSERKKTGQNYVYSWEKTLVNLKKHIVQNYKTEDKIATLRELALILNVSPNTVRRALKELFLNGNLVSKRGKTGGIFIIDMPELDGDSYRWIALNPDVVKKNN